MRQILMSIALTLAFVGGTASAQGKGKPVNRGNESESKKIRYKKDTEVSFDDALIEGSAKSPFASFLSNRDQDIPNGFLKLRYQWHDKMATNINTIGR